MYGATPMDVCMTTLLENDIMQSWYDEGSTFINMIDRGITLQFIGDDSFHDFVDNLTKARNALDNLNDLE